MAVNIQDLDVVFVRYSNDIDSLLYKFYNNGFHVKVYEKHPEVIKQGVRYFVPLNKGNEASGYLKYIIEHYYTLPTHVAFLHDHEFSWHHYGSIFDRILENVGRQVWYRNLNSFVWSFGDKNDSGNIEWFPFIREWYDTYLLPELGPMSMYGDFMSGYQGCAQFIVHRDVIHRRSWDFYMNLYRWILTTELDDYYSGRFLEYTWHLMWEQAPVVQSDCLLYN